jgi:hypothetical protein
MICSRRLVVKLILKKMGAHYWLAAWMRRGGVDVGHSGKQILWRDDSSDNLRFRYVFTLNDDNDGRWRLAISISGDDTGVIWYENRMNIDGLETSPSQSRASLRDFMLHSFTTTSTQPIMTC